MGLNLYLKGLQAGSRAGLLEALGGIPRAAPYMAARRLVGGSQAVLEMRLQRGTGRR